MNKYQLKFLSLFYGIAKRTVDAHVEMGLSTIEKSRNLDIIYEYALLSETLGRKEAIFSLSEKHNLSEKSIEAIIDIKVHHEINRFESGRKPDLYEVQQFETSFRDDQKEFSKE